MNYELKLESHELNLEKMIKEIDAYVIVNKCYPTRLVMTLDQFRTYESILRYGNIVGGPQCIHPNQPHVTGVTFRNIPVIIKEFLL